MQRARSRVGSRRAPARRRIRHRRARDLRRAAGRRRHPPADRGRASSPPRSCGRPAHGLPADLQRRGLAHPQPARDADGRAARARPLPRRVLRRPSGRRPDRPVPRPLVVPRGPRPPPRSRPAHVPDDERRALPREPVGQRAQGRRRLPAAGRLLPVRVRRHQPGTRRPQRDRPRRVPERLGRPRLPDAEHGRLEPAVTGRLDGPAARTRPGPGRAALAARHPRRPARHARPDPRRPHRPDAASQQLRPGAGREAERRPDRPEHRDPVHPEGQRPAPHDAARLDRPLGGAGAAAPPPGRLVAVPDGRAAPLPAAARGRRPRRQERHGERHGRHPHRQLAAVRRWSRAAPTGGPGTASS